MAKSNSNPRLPYQSYQQRTRVHPMRQEEEEEPPGRKFCEVCEEHVIPVEASFPDWTTHGIAIALFLIGCLDYRRLPLLCYFPYVFGIGGQKMEKCPDCHSWFETLELNSNNKRTPQ